MVNDVECLVCGVHLTTERTTCACGVPTTEKPTIGQMTYALEHIMDTGNHVLGVLYAKSDATAAMVGVVGIGGGLIDCRVLVVVAGESTSIETFEFPVDYLNKSSKEAVCVAANRDSEKLNGEVEWD